MINRTVLLALFLGLTLFSSCTKKKKEKLLVGTWLVTWSENPELLSQSFNYTYEDYCGNSYVITSSSTTRIWLTFNESGTGKTDSEVAISEVYDFTFISDCVAPTYVSSTITDQASFSWRTRSNGKILEIDSERADILTLNQTTLELSVGGEELILTKQ